MKALAGCFLLLLGVIAIVAIVAAVIVRMRRDSGHGSSGSLSSAMLEVQALLEPDKRHTIEQVRAEKAEEGEVPGDAPER